ncbi:MAG: response regulator [Schwartzia sp.]|jgi:DNA-binding NarL/FixJ family response regulator|nr:response regulator [Schwartzia sp. (in: firmicutes)]
MERIKVLVVDDSRVSCAMLANMMSKTNFEVCGMASNAADAVLKYQTLRPMAVTMDMNLPDADGIECSRRIREIDPDARIVMISAMRDASLMERGREAGISSFLQKPVSPYELIDALSCIVSDDVQRTTGLRDLYIQSFAKVLRQSLFSLVGIHSEVSTKRAEGAYLDIPSGIAVIIGLTGCPMGRAVIYMDMDTMHGVAKAILMKGEDEKLTAEEASDVIEEAANIIAGRCASVVNDLKDVDMRISPPGTIVGKNIRIANFKITSYYIEAQTRFGNICMNVGFAEGE